MCQIQLIYKRKKLNNEDLDEFIKLMCFGAFDNGDAWGIFNKSHMFKQDKIFNPASIDLKRFTKDNFVVGHNRLECGSIDTFNFRKKENNNLNNHPFELNDFLLIHNGIIHNAAKLFKKNKLETEIVTDSYIIIYLINKYFKMSLKSSRKDKIIDAIIKTTKKLSGWYSVVLYDKIGDELYYFKDDITKFNFCIIDESILTGSTRKLNLKYTYSHKPKKYFIPKDNKIYSIKYSKIDKTFFRAIGNLVDEPPKPNIKEHFNKEKEGEIHNRIIKLPGSTSNYEINENFEVRINNNSRLLKNYFKTKNIPFKNINKTIIFKLEDINNE